MSEHDPVVVPFPAHRTRPAERPQDPARASYRGLQQEGDRILATFAHPTEASDSASDCIAALRARGWDGDGELADTIDTRQHAQEDHLIDLRTDLERIADLLEAKPEDGPGRLDLTTGEAWPEFAFDNDDDLDDDDADGRWLAIWPQGSREAYRDMQLFAETRDDAALRQDLLDALDRPTPFRQFKHALADLPDQRETWHDFSTDRRTGRARAWLAAAGYRALPL